MPLSHKDRGRPGRFAGGRDARGPIIIRTDLQSGLELEGVRMARIAVGGFQHETNTFAPLRATWADFERADAWPGYVRGAELFEAVAGFNIPIAGAVETLRGLGHELVPLSWCSAPPSSYVDEDAYERIAAGMLEDLAEAGPLDGIYLD